MSGRRPPPGLGDYFGHEARSAIHDIRQKLFEEAWFGRVVTGQPMMEVSRETPIDKMNRVAFDELWGRALDHREAEHTKDRDEPDIER
jgi:hypothetical protein